MAVVKGTPRKEMVQALKDRLDKLFTDENIQFEAFSIQNHEANITKPGDITYNIQWSGHCTITIEYTNLEQQKKFQDDCSQ